MERRHKDGKAPVMPLEAEWRKMAGTLIEEQLPVLRRFSLPPRLGPQYANTAPHPTNSSITIGNNLLWLHVHPAVLHEQIHRPRDDQEVQRHRDGDGHHSLKSPTPFFTHHVTCQLPRGLPATWTDD